MLFCVNLSYVLMGWFFYDFNGGFEMIVIMGVWYGCGVSFKKLWCRLSYVFGS